MERIRDQRRQVKFDGNFPIQVVVRTTTPFPDDTRTPVQASVGRLICHIFPLALKPLVKLRD